jgi:short-subunit dehydrogenase
VDADAVVIGAGPGLGRAIARTLAAQGLAVTLVARDAGRLRALADEIRGDGGRAEVVAADAADPAALAGTLSGVTAGRAVRVLSYNPSVHAGSLASVDLAALRAATDVNVHSAVAAVQATLPALEAARGTVLFTGGGAAVRPSAAYGVLGLGKAALRAAAFALADELHPRGVTVRTLTVAGVLAPGTPFDPERVAQAMWQLVTDPGEEAERVYRG